MTEERHNVKVYIPHACLVAPSGVLLGWQDEKAGVCCVTAVCHDPRDNLSQILKEKTSKFIQPVGVWSYSKHTDTQTYQNGLNQFTGFPDHEGWILIEKCDDRVPNCILKNAWLSDHEQSDVTVIVVDGVRLMRSAYLVDRAYRQLSQEDPVKGKSLQKYSIDDVTTSMLRYEQSKTKIKESLYIKEELALTDCVLSSRSFTSRMVYQLLQAMAVFMRLLIWMVPTIRGLRFFKLKVCQHLIEIPAVFRQLKQRFRDLKDAVRISHGTPKQNLRNVNIFCLHTFDVALGVTAMMWLSRESRTETLALVTMDWADNVTTSLTTLLQWLMGAPAGLKLNKQLGQLLGKFFLYHIYLWTGYLEVLRPVLGTVLQIISLSGVLGASVQLAMTRDLVSMMTLHIYCFYVYAARLYSLQVYGLASLWRLFRGKKWNVLRQRVDSASFDIDQLFIGTLFFTILLFLLPTTALYYIVFVTLRLVVLTLQGVLHQLIYLINVLPVASLVARLACPDVVAGTVKVTVAPRVEGRPLYLTMVTQPASFTTIFKTLTEGQLGESSDTWRAFFKHLVTGQLVYPWIKPSKEKAEPQH